METTELQKFRMGPFEVVRVLAFLRAKPEKRKEFESIPKSLAPTRSDMHII